MISNVTSYPSANHSQESLKRSASCDEPVLRFSNILVIVVRLPTRRLARINSYLIYHHVHQDFVFARYGKLRLPYNITTNLKYQTEKTRIPSAGQLVSRSTGKFDLFNANIPLVIRHSLSQGVST